MSGADWMIVVVILVLFVVSIFLALAETAFVRISRVRALTLAEEDRRGARKLVSLLEIPTQTLNSVLLLVLVTQLTSATLLGVLLGRAAGTLGVLIGVLLQVVVFFVIGEVAPKTFAVQHTDRAALAVSGSLYAITHFPPLRFISRSLIGLANVVLPGKGLREGPFVSEEEIRTMADVAADEDAIEGDERRLIHSIFEFGDTVVREVMQPRPDMVAIEADETIECALERGIERGISRLPVYEATLDDVLGIAFLKDLFKRARAGEGHEAVRCAVAHAVVVPEQKRVAELLREMQRDKFHMAIVVDEYGGVAGLVTLEDLLEEIVGEIVDETDVEAPHVEALAGGALRVAGRTSIDEVNEALGLELPDDEWDTVGGLVFNLLGKVPANGETVRFEGLEFRADGVQGHRIVSVTITPSPNGAEPAEVASPPPDRRR
ncbi:MAG TPA: hemolysin family protein [Acidimicrobiia bacterium]|nr:hemolysin family protein [Acidimicrobiia bacterium]